MARLAEAANGGSGGGATAATASTSAGGAGDLSSTPSSPSPYKSPPSSKNHQHKKGGRRKQNYHHHNKKASVTAAAATSLTDAATSVTSLLYTLEDLRTIELNVCARVLSLPEPKTGFYVSKAWIKKTLLWLEKVNEPEESSASFSSAATSPSSNRKGKGNSSNNNNNNKKLSKKQQRQRNRRLSDVSPPWPNANSDILCEHQNLQHCGAKAGRSRRKLMDKHAWKVLCKLYPDSTQLHSKVGECLQCRMEAETARKTEQDIAEQEKLERKKPLSNHHVRQFYTRSKGVPTQCIVPSNNIINESSTRPAAASAATAAVACPRQVCPLVPGTYVILPRAWCHQWRRYIKTGEGSMPIAPDSSALLCDAHKLALLPPHLEAFLEGETPQLLSSVRQQESHSSLESGGDVGAATSTFGGFVAPAVPVGVRPTLDINMVNSLMAAGVSETELTSQRMAMMQILEEQQQRLLAAPVAPAINPNGGVDDGGRRESITNNDLLDRENHVVVELVTQEEWNALVETGCWPKQVSNFCINVAVEDPYKFCFSTLPCRDCDPSGLQFTTNASYCSSSKGIKSPRFRSKRWEPKSVEQKRIPNVEY
eukprot:CAMPEP_0113497662 /NCGR_PEP_ID=MMETSP0014_2-20120614/30748_1 /TAXON_ID=2857 /ORGANISM="Nitzschia sp." /LENGTH=594 /DNA_ID=CAMNT_0000391613 /DNA_START=665 /DNA_END=2449 /DNA_ORIENTATION=+ /assembly_acc=CAM_ASM_000159